MRQFTTYKQALDLKKLGFDKDCLHIYTAKGKFLPKVKRMQNEVSVIDLLSSHNKIEKTKDIPICDAPDLMQAQTWLRYAKGFSVEPHTWGKGIYVYDIVEVESGQDINLAECLDNKYSSYEEALSGGISACIEFILKNKI